MRGERGFRIRVFGCGGAGGRDLFWGFLRSFMLLSFECGKIGRGKACGLVVEKKLKRGGLEKIQSSGADEQRQSGGKTVSRKRFSAPRHLERNI